MGGKENGPKTKRLFSLLDCGRSTSAHFLLFSCWDVRTSIAFCVQVGLFFSFELSSWQKAFLQRLECYRRLTKTLQIYKKTPLDWSWKGIRVLASEWEFHCFPFVASPTRHGSEISRDLFRWMNCESVRKSTLTELLSILACLLPTAAGTQTKSLASMRWAPRNKEHDRYTVQSYKTSSSNRLLRNKAFRDVNNRQGKVAIFRQKRRVER